MATSPVTTPLTDVDLAELAPVLAERRTLLGELDDWCEFGDLDERLAMHRRLEAIDRDVEERFPVLRPHVTPLPPVPA